MRNPDRMIGKEFGVRDGVPQRARRSVNFHLFRSVPEYMVKNPRLVFTTDQGRFYGVKDFIGSDTFNIINLHLVDVENQTVCSIPFKSPICVEPGKHISIFNYATV